MTRDAVLDQARDAIDRWPTSAREHPPVGSWAVVPHADPEPVGTVGSSCG